MTVTQSERVDSVQYEAELAAVVMAEQLRARVREHQRQQEEEADQRARAKLELARRRHEEDQRRKEAEVERRRQERDTRRHLDTEQRTREQEAAAEAKIAKVAEERRRRADHTPNKDLLLSFFLTFMFMTFTIIFLPKSMISKERLRGGG